MHMTLKKKGNMEVKENIEDNDDVSRKKVF